MRSGCCSLHARVPTRFADTAYSRVLAFKESADRDIVRPRCTRITTSGGRSYLQLVEGHAASPRTALELLARIQTHTAHIGPRTFNGTSTATPAQLNLFDALSLPKPA